MFSILGINNIFASIVSSVILFELTSSKRRSLSAPCSLRIRRPQIFQRNLHTFVELCSKRIHEYIEYNLWICNGLLKTLKQMLRSRIFGMSEWERLLEDVAECTESERYISYRRRASKGLKSTVYRMTQATRTSYLNKYQWNFVKYD